MKFAETAESTFIRQGSSNLSIQNTTNRAGGRRATFLESFQKNSENGEIKKQFNDA